jgi:hypothetical protein
MAISRKKQMIIYAFLLFFGVVFFAYSYYKASSIKPPEVPESASVAVNRKLIGDVKINSDLFGTDKFRNLRFDKLPAVSFPVGKRNPFKSY